MLLPIDLVGASHIDHVINYILHHAGALNVILVGYRIRRQLVVLKAAL